MTYNNKNLILNRFIYAIVTLLIGLKMVTVYGQSEEIGPMPKPSYPNFVAVNSVEDVMPHARIAVTNENAFLGHGLGIVKAGEKVILVTSNRGYSWDPKAELYVEAIIRAYTERDVTPILMHDYEIVGVTKDEYKEYSEFRIGIVGPLNSRGWVNGCGHFNINDFLETTRPDLHALCNPPDLLSQMPEHLKPVHAKLQRLAVGQTSLENPVIHRVHEYMEENPDVKGVFYGTGGAIWENFNPKERWLGLFRFDNQWEIMSSAREFPADVWMLSEEITMEPLGSSDKATIVDPEGTDVWWDLTEDQAQRWEKGVYLRGHLFMFPQEAYGGYGLNVLNYPANVPEYISATPIVKLNGTLAARVSHNGYYPRMVQVWEDGYLKEVQGGGTYGELLRTLMKMPGIHDHVWPHYDEPGYFWHYETALGTNPKVVRPDLRYLEIAPERERDGVMHWAFGAQVWHDPDTMTIPAPSSVEFEEKYKLPARYHTFHQHTLFNTMKVRIRGTDRWVTLVDRGRSSSLDSPAVRALASRYGDPDKVLATDWIPSVPGINAPGDYESYASDPFPYEIEDMERVSSGEFDTYNPYVRSPN